MSARKATIPKPSYPPAGLPERAAIGSPADTFARDEMNLAEFPLTLMTDTVKAGVKTLYFEDTHGRLTITGSDAYGLPTANDADVLIALQALTKLKNDFTSPKVDFTKYELLKILGWENRGESYHRLDQSFNRWGGVWLVYDKCWYDNRRKRYVSAKMHIIESVVFADTDEPHDSHASPKSTFTWNQTFIESCQADNLRALDLKVYRSLKNPLAKRLYRFLGKRFYKQADWTFDLKDLAFEHVGISRDYRDAGKIKEKLAPALKKLETAGFLEPLESSERYHMIEKGKWTIRLSRSNPAAAPLPLFDQAERAADARADELVKRGVALSVATALVAEHPAEVIALQIEHFDFLMATNPPKKPRGFLVDSIRGGYAAPDNFVSRAEQEQRQTEQRAADRKKQAERTAQAQARAEEAALDARIKAMMPDERHALEQAALDAATDEQRELYQNSRIVKLGPAYLASLTRDFLKSQAQPKPPAGSV